MYTTLRWGYPWDYQAALTLVTTEISNASIVQPGYVVSGLQP
jgi:hypothetical protein